MKKALFPGTFDPIHKGHLQIIKKATELFDFVIIAITNNQEKKSSSSIEKRYEYAKKALKNFKNIELIMNDELMTANLAKKLNIKWIIRSGRNNTDFNYELELAAGNKNINKDVETIMIFPNYEDIDFSSRLLKQRGEKW
ncbi:MAG: pantetheine-phosphate adenylyltransferase [Mycoplasmatales bacterium]|nr:pantetheine-phosphate adenylyltransferase [Mycoplasmatales bacterium]